MTTTCLCDTGKLYDDCCGRWHSGRPAPTALALMRSRYTAFALEFGDYLLDTWHPDTRPETLDLDPDTEWTGLRIDATSDGKAWDTEGTVTFTASFTSPDGRASCARSAASSSTTVAGTTTTAPTEAEGSGSPRPCQ